MLRIVEPIASQGITGKAAVFQTGIIVNPHAQEEFRRIHKCFRRVYVQTRGEVAERLKAAVC
jgi:hypothetical protein